MEILAAAFAFVIESSSTEDPPPQPAAEESAAQEGAPLEVPAVVIRPPDLDDLEDRAVRTSLLDTETLRERNVRILPDQMLREAGVGVQRTGPGQSSPFIHGFTGFRTLYILDGFRFNHSAWREGPNQYFATVDPESIETLRLRFGTGGVRFGSDAVGGTVEMETIVAGSALQDQDHSALIATRLASAEQALMGRFAGGGRPRTLRYHAGVTVNSFGDLSGGRHVGLQPGTSYNTNSVDTKLSYDVGESSEVTVAYQRERQIDVPRTHRTVDAVSYRGTSVGSDLHRDLDQHRDMVYLRVHWEEAEMIDRARFGVMLHDQFENQDRLRSTFVTEYQEFDVRTYGMYFNVEKETDLGLFRAGVDGCWDFVDSERTDYNPSGSVQSVFVQGAVADDSNVLLGGVFFENDYPLTEHLTLNSGVRYTYSRVEADQVVDPTGPGALEIDDRYQALSGEIGLHYQWDEHLATSVTGSRAVRTPNLSDLTRFDSARTNEIETPSPGLREERFTTVQLGSRVECEQSAVEVTGYMTWIDDLIVRFPTGAVIGGANEVRKANAGSGRVWGIDLAGTQQLCTAWSTRVHGSYVIGDSRNFVAAGMTDREPVSKLPPLRGGIDLRYDHPGSSVWVEAGYTVAAKQDRLSSSDEGDTSRIPPGGTPGYQVVSIRGGCEPIENLTVLAAVENLTNEDYRLHGSGVNEPGTNAILGVRWRF